MQETRTQTAQVINKRLDAKLHQNSKQSDEIGNTTMMAMIGKSVAIAAAHSGGFVRADDTRNSLEGRDGIP
jgi:hypothetical protein